MTTSPLFTPLSINSITLKNRFVRSATWEGLAGEDGSVTERLLYMMNRLAAGELGMIISGHAYVSPEGQAGPWQLGIYDDRLLPGLTEMAACLKRHGSLAIAQLAHAGGQAIQALTGTTPLAPSPITGRGGDQAREMTLEEIAQTIQAFADAAVRAQRAGFDGVQLHAAHGFLLSQFLSPYFNRRIDKYGGSMTRCDRLLLETAAATRAAVGPDYPILVKINSEDFIDDGFSIADMVEVCQLLEDEGIDAIELSGGTIDAASRYSAIRQDDPIDQDQEVYYRDAACRYKSGVGIPLILVGGIRSFEVAEQLVKSDVADAVSLSRPLINEPGLVARWKSGDRSASACTSCNECFEPARTGEGIQCILD